MTDEEIKQQYYSSQGLNTHDASRQYFLKESRKKVNKKSGLYKLNIKQLKQISMK